DAESAIAPATPRMAASLSVVLIILLLLACDGCLRCIAMHVGSWFGLSQAATGAAVNSSHDSTPVGERSVIVQPNAPSRDHGFIRHHDPHTRARAQPSEHDRPSERRGSAARARLGT